MGSLRTFIACTDDKLRLALHMFLDNHPGITVVGISDRLKGLLSQLEGSEPDVLLLDWVSPIWPMVDLLGDLRELEYQPRVVVFSIRSEEKETILAAGADYVIVKDAPPDELIPILNEIRSSINNVDKQTQY